MRDLFLDNELVDDWLYWGYRLDAIQPAAAALVRLLLSRVHGTNASCWRHPPAVRILAELHYSYTSMRDLLSAFGPRSPLRVISPACGCRVVSCGLDR